MGMIGSSALGVLVTVLVLVTAVQAVFDGYDGMPRPAGMDQDPTTTYGPKPAVTYENKAANCVWYGWENGNYPVDGTHNCSTALWLSLSNANPADLQGFMYYAPQDSIYYDPDYNEYLCAIGCFDLSASGPTPATTPVADSPGSTAAPPLASSAPPAPAVDSPGSSPVPPVASSAPPPAMTSAPPAPATLFRPPPPPATLPPSIVPVVAPSIAPVMAPMSVPVMAPSIAPMMAPSGVPMMAPSIVPVMAPSSVPVMLPSDSGVPPSAPTPGSSPGAQSPGPSGVQTAAGATKSVSAVLVLAVLLINFLV